MSVLTVTIIDGRRSIHSDPHGSFVCPFVAALSAEPETIEEFEAALRRFLRPERMPHFDCWGPGVKDEPYDAGICIIDLSARLIVCESTYTSVSSSGSVEYWKGETHDTLEWVPYHLSQDWHISRDMLTWEGLAERRRRDRAANTLLDARAILYGKVTEFIVRQCFEARAGLPSGGSWSAPASWWRALPERVTEGKTPQTYDAISELHARWLMTPRDDLRGKSPREVLLEKKSFINWDLQDRSQQWSFVGIGPPPLDRDTAAYRFAGFGTHEFVLYYDLLRDILQECWKRVIEQWPQEALTIEEEIARLDQLKEDWLRLPHPGEHHSRTPSSIIEHERARIPMVMGKGEGIVDDDCPLCRMMADEAMGFGPMFWHLDGSHFDPEFPFSDFATREAWEADQREWEEFNRRFEEQQQQRKARDESEKGHGSGDEEPSPWKSSFPGFSPGESSPAIFLFGIGSHLAEIITTLKETPDAQPIIDRLNRYFGNLRDVGADPAGGLLEPVVNRFCEELLEVGKSHPELAAQCSDLERQLINFVHRLQRAPDSDEDEEDGRDDEAPF